MQGGGCGLPQAQQERGDGKPAEVQGRVPARVRSLARGSGSPQARHRSAPAVPPPAAAAPAAPPPPAPAASGRPPAMRRAASRTSSGLRARYLEKSCRSTAHGASAPEKGPWDTGVRANVEREELPLFTAHTGCSSETRAHSTAVKKRTAELPPEDAPCSRTGRGHGAHAVVDAVGVGGRGVAPLRLGQLWRQQPARRAAQAQGGRLTLSVRLLLAPWCRAGRR